MKTKKRIFAVLTAAVTAALLIFSMSCDNNTGGKNDKNENGQISGGENENAGAQEQQEDGQDQRVLSEAPVMDFEGYEYRVLSRDESNARWCARDIAVEVENGDPLNDAVYKRNVTIEEKYNIKIINRMSPNMINDARKSINSSGDDYDIMMGGLGGFAEVLAQGGMLSDLKNVPYLDLAKPWYDQKANEQLTIANKLYVTISDISTIARDATWAYLFNKQILAELALDSPYQLVRDGTWTIDKMLAMCKDVSKDLNGDGKMDMNDLYGYAGETENLYYGIISAGSELIKKDSGDMPVYVGLDDAGLTVFNKLLTMLGDKNISLRADDWYGKGFDVWLDGMDASFTANRILFFDTNMANVQAYRNMETDFGIIPPPKSDEKQKEYISNLTVMWTNSLCIPITVSDFERTGIITDALAAESIYTVIPAYYEIQLKTKIARDEESSEMLDLIFAGRKYDLGMIYNWGGISSKFSEAMQRNSPNIVSALEAIGDKVKSEIQKTVDAYESFFK
jgi:hypothetical protein